MAAKRRYKKSTPVTRLLANVIKMHETARLVASRIGSWAGNRNIEGDPQEENVRTSGVVISAVVVSLEALSRLIREVEVAGFVPPRKSLAILVGPGDEVSILAKHRGRYEAAYAKIAADDPEFLDGLQVLSELPTGEILVQRRKKPPFPVRRSHLRVVKKAS